MRHCCCQRFLVGYLRLVLLSLHYLVDWTYFNDNAVCLFKLYFLDLQFHHLVCLQLVSSIFIIILLFIYNFEIKQTVSFMTQKKYFFQRKQIVFCKFIKIFAIFILKLVILFKMSCCVLNLFYFLIFSEIVSSELFFIKFCIIFKLRYDWFVKLLIFSENKWQHAVVHKHYFSGRIFLQFL